MLARDLELQLALAGVCQAAALVQQVARKGQCEQTAYEATINSLVVTDPDETEQVFGSMANMRLGFNILLAQLDNSTDGKNSEVTRYIASLLSLERKLTRNRRSMHALAENISRVQRQVAHINIFEMQALSSLAGIYSDVISPLTAKIQVAGNPANLKQTSVQHKIRALLLAGVRAAVLWRQLGGKRRDILFQRRKVLRSVERAIHLINQSI